MDNYIRECDSKTRTDVEKVNKLLRIHSYFIIFFPVFKENAHFYFSEAIISAVEFIKCNEYCKKHFDSTDFNIDTLHEFEWSFHQSNPKYIQLSSIINHLYSII